MDGAEVVQIYFTQENPTVAWPPKELKGSTKVRLEPGTVEEVQLKIEMKYAASFWDEERRAWMIEKDTYTVLVANSSQASEESTLVDTFKVTETNWWNGL